MRDAIAIIMAILGTVLVLSGAAAVWAAALTGRPADGVQDSSAGPATTGTRASRSLQAMSRMPAPDRLIVWGIVLLALSAIAVGAVTFGATATAGTR